MAGEWNLLFFALPSPSSPLSSPFVCPPPFHLPLLLLCSFGKRILSRLTHCIPSPFVPPHPPLSSSSSTFLSSLPLLTIRPLGSRPLAHCDSFVYLFPFFQMILLINQDDRKTWLTVALYRLMHVESLMDTGGVCPSSAYTHTGGQFRVSSQHNLLTSRENMQNPRKSPFLQHFPEFIFPGIYLAWLKKSW